MSKQIEITEDTTLEDISTQMFGDSSHTPWIWGANASRATSKVVAGEFLIIPGEAPADMLVGKDKDEMTIQVDGLELQIVSARIIRTMDTGTSGWTCKIPWTPGLDPALDKATRPYGYTRAAAYIGGELLVSGILYVTEPEMTDTGMAKVLTGFSFTADAVDSSWQPPYEYGGATLEQLASIRIPTLGVKTVVETDTGGPFKLATAHESDTIFAFLSKLATERGLLLGDTPQGDLLIHRAKTDGEPVGTIEETLPMAVGWKVKYDGRKRFSVYKCITPSGTATAEPLWGAATTVPIKPTTVSEPDPQVTRPRFLTFRADDATPGNVKDAARWRKNKQYVESLTTPLPVEGWYAPNGELWRENTLVTVVSGVLGVPKGFTFLIRSVEFLLEDKRTTMLQLIPPQAYTKKDIGNVWELG